MPASARFSVAKWFDNHTAAVSITLDTVPDPTRPIDDFVLSLGLVLDYELVTQRIVGDWLPDGIEEDISKLIHTDVEGVVFDQLPHELVEYHLSDLVGYGFGYFGHGHWHVAHAQLSYSQAYDSFRLGREIMESLDLRPVAYAYPRNSASEETQRALANAGFLAARRASEGHEPYILSYSELAPKNWFNLPAVVMESYMFRECDACINNTEELIPILETAIEKSAWIIPVYHNIGDLRGWGWYHYETFKNDMRAISGHDFWVAPMNDVILYIRERENIVIDAKEVWQEGMLERMELTLSDGSDDYRFDQPLTVLFEPPAEWLNRTLVISQDGQVVDEVPLDDGQAMFSVPPNEKPYNLRIHGRD